MNRIVLQIPVNPTLREKAEKEARAQGFSSLQDIIRLFLKKLVDKKISVTLQESVQLSSKAAKRYDKMIAEIESGRVKTQTFNSAAELITDLKK